MAKDPAMLWYWNDWNGGTMTLSRHLKGCYMDLLSAQFNSGPLSLDQIKTVLGTDKALWDILSVKFRKEVNSGGVEVFFNERMETEKNKRAEFSNKQKEKVLKRWERYHGNTPVYTIKENVNENRNENEINSFEKSEKLFLKNPELWSKIKQDFFNSEGWQYMICTEKSIERQELIKKMREFVTDLDLKGEYKDLQELKRHFINWFNKQKKSNGSSSKQQQQANARAIAIETGKREFAELVRKSNVGN